MAVLLTKNSPLRGSSAPWIVAITGASGIVYARRLLRLIAEHLSKVRIELVISDAAYRVMQEEESLVLCRGQTAVRDLVGFDSSNITVHDNLDIGASIASGSCRTSGMIVVPCSMSTLAAISCGLGDTLIHRAADVVIKEGRRLILVPRETPLSAIHLENMLKLSKLGVTILPAMPGFYNKPTSLSELIDMLVMRMLDQMCLSKKLENSLGGISIAEPWK